MLTYEPKYDRSDRELEEFLIFVICVAGKNADQTIRKVANLVPAEYSPLEHFQKLCDANTLNIVLREHRIGQYSRIGGAIRGVLKAKLNLRTCSTSDLESIYGIGPKTARFFIMFTRPNQRFACLDTHILRWLRQNGIKAPKSTPTGKAYLRLETTFLGMCDDKGLDPTTMDYSIWQEQRGPKNV